MREDEEYMTIDLRKIFYQIMQNIVTIGLITLACAVAGYLVSAFLIKPTYSASAQMLVNNRRDEQQSTAAISQSDINASSSLVSTYSIILKSHDVLEKVIDDCNLSYSAETLSKMVTVSSVNSTQVMRISVTNGNAQEALDICADLVKLAPDAIIRTIDAGSVTTVSSPYTTGRPVSPSKSRNTLIAGLLGLFACLVYIVIKEITNDKFKTTDDIRTVLDLNILGVIPEENPSAVSKAAKANRRRTVKKKKKEGQK